MERSLAPVCNGRIVAYRPLLPVRSAIRLSTAPAPFLAIFSSLLYLLLTLYLSSTFNILPAEYIACDFGQADYGIKHYTDDANLRLSHEVNLRHHPAHHHQMMPL